MTGSKVAAMSFFSAVVAVGIAVSLRGCKDDCERSYENLLVLVQHEDALSQRLMAEAKSENGRKVFLDACKSRKLDRTTCVISAKRLEDLDACRDGLQAEVLGGWERESPTVNFDRTDVPAAVRLAKEVLEGPGGQVAAPSPGTGSTGPQGIVAKQCATPLRVCHEGGGAAFCKLFEADAIETTASVEAFIESLSEYQNNPELRESFICARLLGPKRLVLSDDGRPHGYHRSPTNWSIVYSAPDEDISRLTKSMIEAQSYNIGFALPTVVYAISAMVTGATVDYTKEWDSSVGEWRYSHSFRVTAVDAVMKGAWVGVPAVRVGEWADKIQAMTAAKIDAKMKAGLSEGQ